MAMKKMIYEIYAEKSYRKQYRHLKKRGYDMERLDEVVFMLASGEALPPKYRDHPLQGDRRGYRDCHIQGDWVLIYKIDKGVLTLILSEIGRASCRERV